MTIENQSRYLVKIVIAKKMEPLYPSVKKAKNNNLKIYSKFIELGSEWLDYDCKMWFSWVTQLLTKIIRSETVQVLYKLEPYECVRVSSHKQQQIGHSAILELESLGKEDHERITEHSQDYADFIAYLEMVYGLYNMTLWEWFEWLDLFLDYSLSHEIQEFRLWLKGGISNNYITDKEIKNNCIYQQYLEYYRRNNEDIARKVVRYNCWNKAAEVYSLNKAMKKYARETSGSPIIKYNKKYRFAGKFLVWCRKNYNGPFAFHDKDIRDKFYNMYPAFIQVLLDQFEIFNSFDDVMDKPIDVVEWVEQFTGMYKQYKVDDPKPTLYMEPRGAIDLKKIGGAPKTEYLYPFVEIFVREAFRFNYENGMRRKLTSQEEQLIRSFALDMKITTYQKVVRLVQKASKPDEEKTLELVTTPREFVNLILRANINPNLSPSHLYMRIRWVEGAQEYFQPIYRIHRDPHLQLGGWYQSSALAAKHIRKMVKQYGFEIIDMTNQQINDELDRIRKNPKMTIHQIILTVQCTNCRSVHTKLLKNIIYNAHCSNCMPKIHTNEAYAVYVLTEILSMLSGSFDSFLRTDLEGEKLSITQKKSLWRNQHVLIKDLLPHKIGAVIIKENGRQVFDKSYYQYKTDKGSIVFYKNVHVDAAIFVKVRLRNADQFVKQEDGKTDMVFKFILERQGKQHEDSWEAFIAWLKIHKEKDIAAILAPSGDIKEAFDHRLLTFKQKEILEKEYKKWQEQVQRDQDKFKLFEYYKKDGFYLLIIDHTVKPNQILEFLCSKITEIVNSHSENTISFEEIRQILGEKLMPYYKYIPWLKQRTEWRDMSDYFNKTA